MYCIPLRLPHFALLMGLIITLTSVRAQTPNTKDEIFSLATLRQGHPRLLALPQDFERVATERNSDPYVKEAFQKLYKKGEHILEDPISKYVIPDGLRLLATSRRVLDRVSTLGFLYRITKEKRFAERAWQELYAASRFPDWNPKHFLDEGEMTCAFALGYDWLYDYWDKDRRNILKSAIMDKGLSRALLAYEGLATSDKSWWTDVPHNWNQVCNGGIGMGALAIADEEPALSAMILNNVLQRLPKAMVHFAPDGAWNEGPGYWSYATKYNVFIIAALKTALGTDRGLAAMEGFSKTGLFPLYMNSPIDKSFNYADGEDHPITGSQLFWFAREFHQPLIAQYLIQFRPADPFALLWYDPTLVKADNTLSPDAYFRMAEVATLRSKWNDPLGTYVAFKAGDNKANHSHLDLGSFVLDALGQRWILDLGADDYNMPGYFNTGKNGQRWQYYRTRAEGHNTLVIHPDHGPDQDPEASTRIVQFNSGAKDAFGIMDLTPAYGRQTTALKRGIALASNRQMVVVEDEITNRQPEDVFWFAHTGAEITLSLDKRSAILSQGGKFFGVNLVYPTKAQFDIRDAQPLSTSPHPTQNNPNKGIKKLSIHLKEVSQTRIVVVFHPIKVKVSTSYIGPLSSWGNQP